MCAQTMIELVTKYNNHEHNVAKDLIARKKQKKQIIKSTAQIHHNDTHASSVVERVSNINSNYIHCFLYFVRMINLY